MLLELLHVMPNVGPACKHVPPHAPHAVEAPRGTREARIHQKFRNSSAFPVYYRPTWLETCLHNHQDYNFRVAPMLYFISVHCHGGSARAAQRHARCARFRLKSCGVESHAF